MESVTDMEPENDTPEVNVEVDIINVPADEPVSAAEPATPTVVVFESEQEPVTPSAAEIAHEVSQTTLLVDIATKLDLVLTHLQTSNTPEPAPVPEPEPIVIESPFIEPDEPPTPRGLARLFRNEWKVK